MLFGAPTGILPAVIDDPRFLAIEEALSALALPRVVPDPERAQAAVALVLRARDPLELLLIRRALREGDPWSGHIALPGGRRSPGDVDLSATAFRETEEETGIRVTGTGRVLGRLGVLTTPQRLPSVVISSFVAAVPPDTTAQPDLTEVVDAAWIPVPVLRSVEAASEHRIERLGEELAFPSIVYGDYVIWGLTHRILTDFLDVLERAGI